MTVLKTINQVIGSSNKNNVIHRPKKGYKTTNKRAMDEELIIVNNLYNFDLSKTVKYKSFIDEIATTIINSIKVKPLFEPIFIFVVITSDLIG